MLLRHMNIVMDNCVNVIVNARTLLYCTGTVQKNQNAISLGGRRLHFTEQGCLDSL